MNLDDIEFDIKIIENSLYYKVFETNKIDQKCNNIREIIINEKNKLRDITLNKCVIINDIVYHKDRLWVSKSMYTLTIQEIHDHFTCNHFEVASTYKLLWFLAISEDRRVKLLYKLVLFDYRKILSKI